MEAAAVSTVNRKPKIKHDAKRIRRKGTPEQLKELHQKIVDQSNILRAKKNEQGDGEKWRKDGVMREIFNLMALKYDYCCASPEPIPKPAFAQKSSALELYVDVDPPHIIKVRWKIRKPDGSIVRLQRPFFDVTSITGQQVIDAVKTITTKANKFPELNGFVKIEHIVTNALGQEEDPSKHLYRTVLPTDRFDLPLTFPGPILQTDLHLNLRVTFPEQSNHLITPPQYTPGTVLPELVDCGVNLFDETLAGNAQVVINRAIGAGVSQLLLISVNPDSSKFNVDLAQTRQNTLFTLVGVHPDDAQSVPIEEFATIKSLLSDPSVVGVGECGIDTKRAIKGRCTKAAEDETEEEKKKRIDENLQKQETWLIQQIEVAIEVNKPLLFHVRMGHEKFMSVISKYKEQIRGKALINCFTGTEAELKEYLDLGFYIGITGFLCNKARGVELQTILKTIPLDKIVLGSDAPYLTPFSMPKPYPKFNEPCYLPHILTLAAECIGIPYQKLAEASTKNIRTLFKLPVTPYDGFTHKFATYSPNLYKGIAKVIEKPVAATTTTTTTTTTTSTETAVAPSGTEEGKPAEEKVTEPAPEPEPEHENVFVYNGKKYDCSPKEKAILEKQKKLLDDQSFADLFSDFSLKEL